MSSVIVGTGAAWPHSAVDAPSACLTLEAPGRAQFISPASVGITQAPLPKVTAHCMQTSKTRPSLLRGFEHTVVQALDMAGGCHLERLVLWVTLG